MSRYTLNWDLDSLLPHPSTPEFAGILEGYRTSFEALAERSEKLPALSAGATPWVPLLREFERLESLAGDLNSFIGCCAAADAGNKQYRQIEAALSALEPLRERVSTNIEFAF